MSFLKPSQEKIFLFSFFLAIVVLFFLPFKVNLICEPNESCPPNTEFVKLFEFTKNQRIVSLNYSFLITELISIYILACGVVSLLNKK